MNFISLAGEKLLEAFAVEADHHLIVNNDRRSGAALVLSDQVVDCAGIAAYVALFESNSSLREEGRGGVARRSAGLSKDYDPVSGHLFTA